jgi:hypothetical protein
VVGGRIRIEGALIEPGRVGLLRPREVLVLERGAVATRLEQPATGTTFGFSRGCRLRLQIEKHTSEGDQHAD